MDWLLSWLQTQLTFGQACRFILTCLVFDVVWCFVLAGLFHFLKIKISKRTAHFRRSEILRWSFPFRLFRAVTIEEVLFRFFPLTVALSVWGATWPTVMIAFLSSIIFGWIHGNIYNVLIQGVGGLIFCFIFLKCGGFSHHHVQALFFSIAAHYLFNSLIALIVVLTESSHREQNENL